MHPVAVAVAISAGGGVARVPVPRLPDPSSKRRRLSVKGPAPSLYPPLPQPPVADPVIRLRRLRIKGPAPFLLPRPPQSPAAVLPLSTSLWKDQNEVTFEFLPHRRKYRWIYNKFQYWFFDSGTVWAGLNDSGCTEELWKLGLKDFGSLSKRQKNIIMRHFLHCTGAPRWVMKYAVRQWHCDPDERRPKLILKSQTALLTFQGDWGVLELGPNLPPNPTIGELAFHVKEMQRAQTLWKAFSEFAEQLAADLHAPNWACCFEICTRTFEEEKQLRLHGHLYLKSDVQQLRCEFQSKLRFMDSDPHLKDTLWGKKVGRANWAGAYYCLAPKLGSVFRHGSVQRFRDFPIDPSWIFNMIESGKLLYEEARAELVRCGKGLVRRVADLECWHKNKQEMLVREMVAAAQSACRSQLRPFPRWPVVDAWLTEVTKPLQSRKKCLVLHGPSRTGKTEFVRGLFSLGAVLELNCSNLKDICLDGFDCLRHRAILWDEANAALVSNNRKVFQHPQCEVDLGHSPTGQHVRRYFLGNCCSIITTNKWYQDVAKLPSGDQEWLSANMVVVDVDQPMWENPCPLERCQQALSRLQI